jgi:hypothetical protein
VASRSIDGLVRQLREAGELLRAVGEVDDRMALSRRLLDVAHEVDALRSAASEAPRAIELVGEPVPIESLGYDTDIVPIESLAPSQPPAGQQAADRPRGIELSFRTFHRLQRERTPQSPSLDALLDRTAPGPHSLPSAPVAEEPVAIGTLCYRGHAALQRAIVVRHQIAAELKQDATLETLQPLLQELLDLVPLALVDS